MNNNGYIKLYRSMLEWEWWKAPNTAHIFLYLLLSANISASNFKGMHIKRGQLFTTYPELSQGTGLSQKAVRVALKHLEKTASIEVSATTSGTLITVINFEKFQNGADERSSQTRFDSGCVSEKLPTAAEQGQSVGRQRADEGQTYYIKEEKEEEEYKKNKKGERTPTKSRLSPTRSGLSPEQKNILVSDFGLSLVEAYIAKMRNWQSRRNIRSVDEFVTLTKWLNEDKEKNAAVPKKADSESSFDVLEIERQEAKRLKKKSDL